MKVVKQQMQCFLMRFLKSSQTHSSILRIIVYARFERRISLKNSLYAVSTLYVYVYVEYTDP